MATATLAELVDEGAISYGIVQPGQHVEGGVPILRVGDLESGTLEGASPVLRVSPELEARFNRTRLQGGEVLVSLVGSVGRTALVPSSLAGWNVARAVAVLRPRHVEPEWLYYALRSPSCQAQISAALNTTVQATLNLSDLKTVLVPMPDRDARLAIAEVLGALDDKIEENRRVVEVADRVAREAYSRFSSAELIDLADLVDNPRTQAQPPFDGGVYVGLEHVPRRHMWMSEFGCSNGLASGKFCFEPGDVLFGKLRPYFHKVVVADRPGLCSTDILVVRPRSSTLRGFVWAAVSSDSVVGRVSAMAEGTRMPRTSWSDLAACQIPWPGDEAAEKASRVIESLGIRASASYAESRQLAQLRDTLLPNLMSGRISVRQAETLAEGVL